MADTNTPKLGLIKPEVAGSRDLWGDKLNSNFDVIDNLAPLASPVFTGDPKAPNPAPGDNDTSIATTSFVNATVNAGVATVPPFPEAPNDGKQYARQSLAWASIIVPPSTSISDAAPSSPSPGQLWWESDSGNTFIWVDDGNTQQWVQQNVMPSSAGITQDVADTRYVNVSGDTMTGALTVPSLASTGNITAAGSPVMTAANLVDTGTNSEQTNWPIGTTLLCWNSSNYTRAQIANPYIITTSGGQWCGPHPASGHVAGAVMSGSWRHRGGGSFTAGLFLILLQRVT